MAKRKKGELPFLVDGKHVSEGTFDALLKTEEELLLFEVYDDGYKPMGHAVGKVVERFEPAKDGAFIRLKYLGCQNDHYKWYVDNEGAKGGLPEGALHHLCRSEPGRCPAKIPKGGEIIHVRRWAPVERKVAHDILKDWGYAGLVMEPEGPPPRRSALRGTSSSPGGRGSAPATATKKKPKPSAETPAHLEEEVDWGGGDDDEDDDREASPPKKKVARVSDEAEALKAFLNKSAALDHMLERGVGTKGDKELDDRLATLKAKLQGRTSGLGHTGKKPGGILARRATEALEAQASKPRKRQSSGAKVLSELKKAVDGGRNRRRRDSRESSASEDEEDEDPCEKTGAWDSKRKRYKRIAERSPGQLMMHTLDDMEETLGAKFGDSRSKDAMNPIVTRYLLSVISPALGAKISKSALREMRTIALSMDLILKGRAESAGDVLLQRFKSLCMQARDGSEKFGPQIELLPEDMLESGGSLGEDAFAKEVAYRDMKKQELAAKTLGGGKSAKT